MGLLHNSTNYLLGPIDRSPDGGVGWRKLVTPRLKFMGVRVIDPTAKPKIINHTEDASFVQYKRELRATGKYQELANLMADVRNVDLRFCDHANFGIFYLDLNAQPVGSYEECFLLNHQKKPVLIMFEQGISSCPDWLFGAFKTDWREFFFEDWDSMFTYLDGVNSGKPASKRWVLFDF